MDGLKLSHSKGLTIVHLNVRSLYKKIGEILLLYKDIDFLLFCKTWFDSRNTVGMISIPNYVPFRLDRCSTDHNLLKEGKIQRRGGGVIIYVKSKWVPYVQIFGDGTVITENYEKPGMRHMLTLCVYKPPKGKIGELLDFLKTVLCIAYIQTRQKWIIGDFNIDYMKRNMTCLKPVKEFLKQYGLTQILSECTRVSNNGKSCIDWFITDCVFVEKCGELNDLLSDHYPIYRIRKKKREYVVKEWKYIRQYQNFDSDNFKICV